MGEQRIEIVRDEQHRHAAVVVDVVNELDDVDLARQIQTGQRFVEQQHVGLRDQRLSNRDALLLAAGDVTKPQVRVILGVNSGQDIVNCGGKVRSAKPNSPPGPDQPEGDEVAAQMDPAWSSERFCGTRPIRGLPVSGRASEDLNSPGRWLQAPKEQVDQCGFTRTVRPDHRGEGSRRTSKVAPLQIMCRPRLTEVSVRRTAGEVLSICKPQVLSRGIRCGMTTLGRLTGS